MIETREQLREIEEHFKRAAALIDDLGNCDDEGQTMGPGAWMSLGLAREAAEKGAKKTRETLKIVG